MIVVVVLAIFRHEKQLAEGRVVGETQEVLVDVVQCGGGRQDGW